MRLCAAALFVSAPVACSESEVVLGADWRAVWPDGGGIAVAGTTAAPPALDEKPAARLDGGVMLAKADAGGPRVRTDVSEAAVPGVADAGARIPDTIPCQLEPWIPAADETCYDFPVHGASSPTDTSPFPVQPGESRNHFYYAVPWPTGAIATSIGVVLERTPTAVRAWAFGVQSGATAPGTVQRNVVGTLLGEQAYVIGTWAAGGCGIRLPEPVGLELPASGEQIMVQWHHMNVSEVIQQDRSVFRICTVAPGSRVLAGLTLLGTENLNGPIGMSPGVHTFSGSCVNDSIGDITIIGIEPYLQTLGIHAAAVVRRAAGDIEQVFERPFRFDVRQSYAFDPPVTLHAGDVVDSICTFNNTTSRNVPFGLSVNEEMCFLVAVAAPPRALDNGVPSLVGASNTCW